MPLEWQPKLKKYADSIGMLLFSSTADKSCTDFLERMGNPIYKIASFEAVDPILIRYVASKMKPMIISVGVCSLDEIQTAVEACKIVGNNDITLLKCTSAYPAKPEDMNLATISDMIDRFGPQGVKIGLSDHSMSIVPPITAVALGAQVIEKHFTLDRALGGEDSGFSLNADEFAAMVKAVRETEKALGRVSYDVNQDNRRFARSLFVVKPIRKGETFTEDNVRSIRPNAGLPPGLLDVILGKPATRDIPSGSPLTEDMF